MDRLVVVLFESSVSLILFYLLYFFWLRKETFFRINRFYLLLSVLTSLIIPWLNFSYQVLNTESIVVRNVLETVTVSANGYETSLIQTISTMQWIGIIYLIGAIVSSLLFVVKIYKITHIDKQEFGYNQTDFGTNVRFVKAQIVPFSFLSKIYINPNNYTQKQLKEIIAHEQVHINQQHTYDCLFYELLIVFFWFHPIVYKYRTSAKELHEFLADEGAISSGISGVEYQQLLFEQATGLKTLTLANSFNYSLVKRRLIMLTKIKSSRIAKIRLLYALPILGALVITFACNTEKDDEKQTQVIEEQAKDLENAQRLVTIEEIEDNETASTKSEDGVYMVVEKMPEFPGGDEAVRMFIAKNIKYPKGAAQKGIKGRVYVGFVVNKEGYIEDVKIMRGVDPLLDEEAIRVVSAMPQWIPGEEKGEKVNVSFTIPINFQLN